jgi:hypothetical protein|tara:strand:- start:96 stop:371 length:276 start_codon:yes stop_codon:yes gene_type:complete
VILTLAYITLAVVLIIVLVVAYHLIGIYIALKRGGDHLETLAGGLMAIRDNTAPLNGRMDEINAGLTALIAPLLAANGNLAAIVKVVTRQS